MKHPGIIFVILFLMSCGNDEIEQQSDTMLEHTILLERVYENHAWGFNFSSEFVTADGKFRRYRTDNVQYTDFEWNYEQDDHSISWEHAKENVLRATEVIGDINEVDLNHLLDLGSEINENLAPPLSYCADAGIDKIWIYNINTQNNKYQKILVKQCGDQIVLNNADSVNSFIEEYNRLTPYPYGDFCCP